MLPAPHSRPGPSVCRVLVAAVLAVPVLVVIFASAPPAPPAYLNSHTFANWRDFAPAFFPMRICVWLVYTRPTWACDAREPCDRNHKRPPSQLSSVQFSSVQFSSVQFLFPISRLTENPSLGIKLPQPTVITMVSQLAVLPPPSWSKLGRFTK